MTYPASDVNTTNADAGTDSPATFRTDVLDLITKFNLLRNHISAFMQGLLTSASATAARTTLGSTTVGDAVFVAANAAAGRTALGAAASGANGDITSLTGLTTPIGGTALGNKIQPITASVGANALTASLNPTALDFRSTTLSSGALNTRNIASTLSLVVPSGATLGTVSAQQSRIVLLAIDNAGTIELAVVNIAGGNDLTETGLISTTTISAGATSASVVYSTTARTSVAYRVLGYVESTQATAGVWATAPSTVQGVGGQALAAMSSLGYGQTWQNMTGSRAIGTTYTNTTGKPISVTFSGNAGSGTQTAIVGGVTVLSSVEGADSNQSFNFIVPAGSTYSITGSGLQSWVELR